MDDCVFRSMLSGSDTKTTFTQKPPSCSNENKNGQHVSREISEKPSVRKVIYRSLTAFLLVMRCEGTLRDDIFLCNFLS